MAGTACIRMAPQVNGCSRGVAAARRPIHPRIFIPGGVARRCFLRLFFITTIMGICASTPVADPGPYQMHSAASVNAPFDPPLGPSKILTEKWGVTRGAPAKLMFYTAEEVSISKDSEPLDGAAVDCSEDGVLAIVLATAAPIQAAIGMPSCDGDSGTVSPRVMFVDIYVTVDGEPQTDGHVCHGEPSLDRAQAIASAAKKSFLVAEDAVTAALNDGPSDGSKPWATVVASEDFGNGKHFVHLPLLTRDLDNILLDESAEYGHSLMAKAAALFAAVGAGDGKKFEIRVAPRGLVDVRDSDDLGLKSEIPNKGDSQLMADAGFAEFARSLDTQQLTDPAAAGFKASFTLNISEAMASGTGPVREAQKFAADWPSGELEECLELARKFAVRGPCGAAAARMAPGSKLAHIVLVGGLNGRVGIASNEGGSQWKNQDFHAWALFKSKDGKPDSEGAQIKFRCVKKLVVDYEEVDDPEWESAGFGMHGDQVNALVITNAKIDEAIERDAEFM